MDQSSGIADSKRPGVFSGLPRISTSVWLIVIGALFLIAMVPLTLNYVDAVSQLSLLQTQLDQLQARYDSLKKSQASEASLTAEINTVRTDLESVRKAYKSAQDNPDISQVLISLADNYDITITSMAVISSSTKILGTDYQALSYTLNLSGQVANFQNFLLATAGKLPASQIVNYNILPAQVEGDLDKATITLQMLVQ